MKTISDFKASGVSFSELQKLFENNTYQYYDDYAFNLSQFDEEYINYIDRLFLEKNNLIKSNTKLNIEYNSILDTLRSVYSEFFI